MRYSLALAAKHITYVFLAKNEGMEKKGKLLLSVSGCKGLGITGA